MRNTEAEVVEYIRNYMLERKLSGKEARSHKKHRFHIKVSKDAKEEEVLDCLTLLI